MGVGFCLASLFALPPVAALLFWPLLTPPPVLIPCVSGFSATVPLRSGRSGRRHSINVSQAKATDKAMVEYSFKAEFPNELSVVKGQVRPCHFRWCGGKEKEGGGVLCCGNDVLVGVVIAARPSQVKLGCDSKFEGDHHVVPPPPSPPPFSLRL